MFLFSTLHKCFFLSFSSPSFPSMWVNVPANPWWTVETFGTIISPWAVLNHRAEVYPVNMTTLNNSHTQTYLMVRHSATGRLNGSVILDVSCLLWLLLCLHRVCCVVCLSFVPLTLPSKRDAPQLYWNWPVVKILQQLSCITLWKEKKPFIVNKCLLSHSLSIPRSPECTCVPVCLGFLCFDS